MSLYIALVKWTDQGRRTYWDTVRRYEEATRVEADFGVEMKEIIWTPGGPYAFIIIIEGADAQSVSSFMLLQQSLGNLDAVWMPGYRPREMTAVMTSPGEDGEDADSDS